MSLTVLLIVEDQDRTRAFYEQVLGASVVRERDPVILQFHNSCYRRQSWRTADGRQA
jgi:lactoylglutathione lyase